MSKTKIQPGMGLLTAMEHGCTLEFPWGYKIIGDPETRYLECKKLLVGEVYHDGLETMDKEGLKRAIQSAIDWGKELKRLDDA